VLVLELVWNVCLRVCLCVFVCVFMCVCVCVCVCIISDERGQGVDAETDVCVLGVEAEMFVC